MTGKKPAKRDAPLIVVLGGINTDYVVRTKKLPEPGQSVLGEPLFVGSGGKGANQAVAAARLGAKVALIGRVGDEPRGKDLVRGLRKEGIDTRHVSLDSKTPSGAAIITVDASGEKQISAGLGANLTLTVKEVRAARELIAQAKILLMNFETPMTCVLEAARIAGKDGVKVVLDPAPPTKVPRELWKLIYAIRPNSDEAEKITGVKIKDRSSARRAAAVLLNLGVKIVAVQAGEAGDLVVSREEEVFVRRLKVKTVDATGAGDAFAAAFAVAIAERMDLKAAARFANAAAALATTKIGAQDGMPRRRGVERVLRKGA
jgi:ribokinase